MGVKLLIQLWLAISPLCTVVRGTCIERSGVVTCRGPNIERYLITFNKAMARVTRKLDIRGCDIQGVTLEFIMNIFPKLIEMDARDTGRCFIQNATTLDIIQYCPGSSDNMTTSTTPENITAASPTLATRKLPKVAAGTTPRTLATESLQTTPTRNDESNSTLLNPDHPLSNLPFRDQMIIAVVVAVILTTAFISICLWCCNCLRCHSTRCPDKPQRFMENNNLPQGSGTTIPQHSIPVDTISMDSVELWSRPSRSKRD